MDPLNSTPPTLEALQRRMAANLQRLQREGRLQTAPAPSRTAATAGRQQPRRALRERLQALDPSDARFSERAADAFVESVLLAEFGDALTNDANFRQLILQVSRDMRGEADTAKHLDQLLGDLRAEQGP